MLWPLTSTYSTDIITSSMGDEVFIFKEKFDRPVARSSTLVKILQINKTKLSKQNCKHLRLVKIHVAEHPYWFLPRSVIHQTISKPDKPTNSVHRLIIWSRPLHTVSQFPLLSKQKKLVTFHCSSVSSGESQEENKINVHKNTLSFALQSVSCKEIAEIPSLLRKTSIYIQRLIIWSCFRTVTYL